MYQLLCFLFMSTKIYHYVNLLQVFMPLDLVSFSPPSVPFSSTSVSAKKNPSSNSLSLSFSSFGMNFLIRKK